MNTQPTTDRALQPEEWSRRCLEEFAAGDAQNLGRFMEQWDRYVRVVAERGLRMSWGVNADEVEDVVNDTFLRLWNRAAEFVAEARSARVAVSFCAADAVHALRRRPYRHREQRLVSDEFEHWYLNQSSDEPDPLTRIVLDADAARIQRSVARLPESERVVVERAVFAGESPAELARQLHTRSSVITRRLDDAFGALRQMLHDFAGYRVPVPTEVGDEVGHQVEIVVRGALLEDATRSIPAIRREVERWTGVRMPVGVLKRKFIQPMRESLGIHSELETV